MIRNHMYFRLYYLRFGGRNFRLSNREALSICGSPESTAHGSGR